MSAWHVDAACRNFSARHDHLLAENAIQNCRHTCVKEAASEKGLVGWGQHDNDSLGLAALRLVHSGGPRQLYLP